MTILKVSVCIPAKGHAAIVPLLLVVAALAACDDNTDKVAYVCEEPLEKYLELARSNIEKDYAIDRSRKLLSVCPDKGFHRRYRFDFPSSALVSKREAAASVEARWCGDPEVRTSTAEVRLYANTLVFAFNYPWSTETGKYPRTEFRLNINDQSGGFSADQDWQCIPMSKDDRHAQSALLSGSGGLLRPSFASITPVPGTTIEAGHIQ